MAKNHKKKKKENRKEQENFSYDVGYKKPPEEYKWKKGCKSPNPAGRPKKPTNLRDALSVALNDEVSVKNSEGQIAKITAAEAMAKAIVADCIRKDGPTRRMLLNNRDLNSLTLKEQEYEKSEEELEAQKNDQELISKLSSTINDLMCEHFREQTRIQEEYEKIEKERENYTLFFQMKEKAANCRKEKLDERERQLDAREKQVESREKEFPPQQD